MGTCPFDSIVQILLTSAIDDPESKLMMQDSQKEVFQFVMNLLVNGPTKAVLTQRAILLTKLFASDLQQLNAKGCISYELNVENTLYIMWKKMMSADPCLMKKFSSYPSQCSHCDGYEDVAYEMDIHLNIIKKKVSVHYNKLSALGLKNTIYIAEKKTALV